MKKVSKRYREKLRLEVLKHYSHKLECRLCRTKDLKVLALDHIKGGGTRHVKIIGYRGSAFYSWLRKNDYPDGYQVLCMNCNWIKQDLAFSRKNSILRKRNQQIKEIVLSAYSKVLSCFRCNISNFTVLTLDHINGGGREHRRKLRKEGTSYYRWLLKQYQTTKTWPNGYQVLCWNCQRIKQYEFAL